MDGENVKTDRQTDRQTDQRINERENTLPLLVHTTSFSQCWNSKTCTAHQGSKLLYHSEAFHRY